MKTVADLARAVMGRCMGLQATHEDLEPEDLAEVTEAYYGLFDEWSLSDLPWWEREEIPEHALQHIADQVAEVIAPAFGKTLPPVNDRGRVVTMGERGRRGLLRLKAAPATGEPVYSDYY